MLTEKQIELIEQIRKALDGLQNSSRPTMIRSNDDRAETIEAGKKVTPPLRVGSDNLLTFFVGDDETCGNVAMRLKNLIGFPLKNVYPDGPSLQIFEVSVVGDKFPGFKIDVKYGFFDAKMRKNEFVANYEFQKSTDLFLNIITRDVEQAFIHFNNTDRKEVGLDLSKYKAFPEGYKIGKGVNVIAIADDRSPNDEDFSLGKKGVTFTYDEDPFVDFEDGTCTRMRSHELAPLDPSDHPDYKDEVDEDRPMDASEIAKWAFTEPNILISPYKMAEKIQALVDYEVKKAKR